MQHHDRRSDHGSSVESPKSEANRNRKPKFLTEKELAARWKISISTLQNNRVIGGGIAYYKIFSAVRYALDDIEAYERRARHVSTSDEGGEA